MQLKTLKRRKNNMIVKVVKVVSKKTFKDKNGKERHYENYHLEVLAENGEVIRIPFNPNYQLDNSVYTKLKLIAITQNANE